jgi:hypothetical protein
MYCRELAEYRCISGVWCRYLCTICCLYAAVLGPWSGWQAACNSLSEQKYEVSS